MATIRDSRRFTHLVDENILRRVEGGPLPVAHWDKSKAHPDVEPFAEARSRQDVLGSRPVLLLGGLGGVFSATFTRPSCTVKPEQMGPTINPTDTTGDQIARILRSLEQTRGPCVIRTGKESVAIRTGKSPLCWVKQRDTGGDPAAAAAAGVTKKLKIKKNSYNQIGLDQI